MAAFRHGDAWPAIKLGLLGLGDLLAFGLVMSMLEPMLVAGLLVGVGYAGCRLYAGPQHALGGADEHRALSADVDYERRMRELDAQERELDARIHALEAESVTSVRSS